MAVGRLKRGFFQEGCERYAGLLRALAPIEIIEVRDHSAGGPAEARRRHEREALAAADGHLMLVDERGTEHTTASLAQRIGDLEVAGNSRITLFIGGPDGHGDELRSAVNSTLSLSPLTLPHELARLVLLEQLYRVESLRAGHPYHRA